MNNTQRVVIVGGGVSGVAAALKLAELSKEKNLPLELLLVESTFRLGGVLKTVQKDGCLLEAGPDAIFTEKPWGLDFVRKAGLEDQIIPTNSSHRASYVALGGRLHAVPEGFYLLAPSKIIPFLFSSLFTIRGKLRILYEMFIPPRAQEQGGGRRDRGQSGDESLASFVLRRFGPEALERVAQPMAAGIYGADAEELSLKSTFPQFLEWEATEGSVIRALLRRRKHPGHAQSSGPRYGLFVSLKNGMQALVDSASKKLPDGTLRFGVDVKEIVTNAAGPKRYKVLGEKFELHADAVCLALPAPHAARMARSLDQALASELGRIRYQAGITVNLIVREADVRGKLNGFGFVVPASEKKTLSGCTFSSIKFPGRAPRGKAVLRAYIGGKNCARFLNRPTKEIEQAVKKELREFLRLEGHPLHVSVHVHADSMPIYKVGHQDIVQRIENRLNQVPGLALAGNGYLGVGIPDCVRSGELAAERLFKSLQNQKQPVAERG